MRDFLGGVMDTLAPFYGPMSLDLLDNYGRAKLSASERAWLDVELRR
jgi:hypothetical protein